MGGASLGVVFSLGRSNSQSTKTDKPEHRYHLHHKLQQLSFKVGGASPSLDCSDRNLYLASFSCSPLLPHMNISFGAHQPIRGLSLTHTQSDMQQTYANANGCCQRVINGGSRPDMALQLHAVMNSTTRRPEYRVILTANGNITPEKKD